MSSCMYDGGSLVYCPLLFLLLFFSSSLGLVWSGFLCCAFVKNHFFVQASLHCNLHCNRCWLGWAPKRLLKRLARQHQQHYECEIRQAYLGLGRYGSACLLHPQHHYHHGIASHHFLTSIPLAVTSTSRHVYYNDIDVEIGHEHNMTIDEFSKGLRGKRGEE